MNVRHDFPILKRKINGKPLVYFDNAATTQKPTQVIDAVADFYRNHNANVGRGAHTLAREATEAFEGARKKVARFIGARTEEIVFNGGATEGLNMVSQNYGRMLGKSDEVVTTIMEHHSNYLPWKMISQKTGAGIKLVDIDNEGSLDMGDYKKKVGKKTALVAATHISNFLGSINPAREMAKIAHENGAVFILDGAQSVPRMPIDVKKLGCDFMVFSGHKVLAPMGVGVLYGRYDLLEEMEPLEVGGGMITKVYPGAPEFLKPPHCFEAGTPDVGGAIGLGAAIDYLKKLGMDKVEKYEEELTEYALGELEGITIYGPKKRAGIISFNIPGVENDDVATIMDENGVAIRSGHNCAQPLMYRLRIGGSARMSFYIYNTKEEVDFAAGVIEKIKKLA